MRVLRSGNLAESLLVDLVIDARRAAVESILEITRVSGNRSFYFRDGRLVAMTTSSQAESFTEMLVRRRKLQQSVAASVATLADADGLTPAQVLLRDRVLPIPDLVKELNLWASLLLIDSFGWRDGEWRILQFSASDAPPETLLEVELAATLLKGVARKMPIDEVRALMQPLRDGQPRHAVPLPFPIVAFDLDAHQQRFWESIDGARTVSEVLDFPSLPRDDVARLLFVLHRTGMLTLGGRAQARRDAEADPGLGDLFDDPDLALPDAPPAAGPQKGPRAARPEPRPGQPGTTAPPWTMPEPRPGAQARAERHPDSRAAARPAREARPGKDIRREDDSGVDLSSIRFRPGAKAASSGTMHVSTDAGRESFDSTTSGAWTVGVVTGRAEAAAEGQEPAPSGLSDLFDGLDLGGQAAAPAAPAGARVAPPRGGKRSAEWRAAASASAAAEPAAKAPVPPEDPDAVPRGAGPDIEQEEWARLTTRDKERVRGLRRELERMETTNYFEWFGLSSDSPTGSIKKAYFQMAKLYHPDSLIDENEIFRRLAEALFSAYSTAYETLSDDEARERYIRKRVFGEKDENELAMERVQLILGAENSFKTGLRFLNAGKLKEALRHFKAAVDAYGEEAEYVAYYGYALFRARLAGEPALAEEGIELMEKAIAMKEIAPKPYHLLGKAWLAKGDGQAAKRYLRKSLKLQPDNPEAVRDYRKADELAKSTGSGKGADGADKKGLLGGIFGRRKKDAGPAPDDDDDFIAGLDEDS